MTAVLGLAALVLFGPCLLAYGVWILCKGAWRDSVPLAEYLIDRAVGIDPPPRNRWDHRFALFQAWMMIALGAFVSLGAAVIFISDFVTE